MKAIVMRARGPPSELFKSPRNNLNDLEENSMKIITIKDYYGKYQEVPVDDALYAEWQELQRESDRIRKKEVYHRDWMPIEEAENDILAIRMMSWSTSTGGRNHPPLCRN